MYIHVCISIYIYIYTHTHIVGPRDGEDRGELGAPAWLRDEVRDRPLGDYTSQCSSRSPIRN